MASQTTRGTSRLNLEIGPKARENLERISERTEQSYSETVRSALALYGLLSEELRKDRSLILRGPDGAEKEIVLPEMRR